MTGNHLDQVRLSRRSFLLALGIGGLSAAGCGRLTGGGGGGGGGGDDALTFLSTQFTPLEEADRFRTILSGAYGDKTVDYVTSDPAPFADRVRSAAQAGNVNIDVLGALHGQFGPVADQLDDVSDVMERLTGAGFSQDLRDLARLGSQKTLYVPWAQATFVMAAHSSAMDALPSGADPQKLTYDQLLAWAEALAEQTGKPAFGLPAGPKGLLHRFLQGFTYPSFTGGVVPTFASSEAQEMWRYLQRLWKVSVPASTNFDFMQEPLASGQVLLAWDHVARLVDAPRRKPGEFTMLPVPSGPAGRGYMPVVAGLAIPKGAPDREASVALIEALSKPEVQFDVLRQNAFFPTVAAELPSDLPPGVSEEAKAVQAQQQADDALLALPPAGLGAREGEFTQIYKDGFTRIVLRGENPATVLPEQKAAMQQLLNEAKAPCWTPDPSSNGAACVVG
ncbi:MAG: ABC transporter substrate-binding protein [Actinomycetota bacterium]|nr:ABC transporter substrate-binding protein [Actinomycetota bacterium]